MVVHVDGITTNNEEYVGDGLYVSFDGFSFKLRAPREGGDHAVWLEPSVLAAFSRYVANMTLKVEAYQNQEELNKQKEPQQIEVHQELSNEN